MNEHLHRADHLIQLKRFEAAEQELRKSLAIEPQNFLAHAWLALCHINLDEPEAALSFSNTLALMSTLDRIGRDRGQVLCATHSPLLAALPGARILEVGDWGWRETAWEDLELVSHWRAFLTRPDRYLRHLLD